MPFFPIMSTWVVCQLRRRRMYGTWHESLSRCDWVRYMGASGTIASFIENICIKLPYAITAASAQTKSHLSEYHHRTKRIALVASGIDLNAMRAIKPRMSTYDALYVGRLVKDKNIDKLVEAMSLVVKDKPNATCVIIGKGIEKPRIERLITRLKLDKNITLLDPIADAYEVYVYMKSSKVFVVPSVREGFGIVSLEALACDTPVITVDSPANAGRLLITNKHMGSIVPLDITSIAAAIQTWSAKKTKEPISQFVAGYDWNALTDAQEKVYQS
jgi:glycosyltransferase involved in cell wall biosynthesis